MLAAAPVYVAMIGYRQALSQRAWVYLALASVLVSMLVYQWVYHRHTAPIPAAALPPAQLSLVPERLPGIVWLALVPPVILMVLLWCVTMYGSTLPWRDSWLGPPQPATSHRMFLMTAIMSIVWMGVASWKVVYALARWHGMARSYPHRRERLMYAVGMQWLALIVPVAMASGFSLYLPALLATTCAITYGLGMFFFIWLAGQEHRMRTESPQTGTWCYFDFHDPTFFGPRGLNLANRWSWALAGAGIAPVLLAEWLYHHAQGQA